MVEILYLAQYDLQPYYPVKVIDSSGAAIDLTGAIIYCTMIPAESTTHKINRQTAGIIIANQTTNKGEFKYQWQSGDTNTVGQYYIEFEINPHSGGKFTLPSNRDGKAQISITAGLDTQ